MNEWEAKRRRLWILAGVLFVLGQVIPAVTGLVALWLESR